MKHLFILSSFACILFSCNKEETNQPASNAINVSCQQYVDNLGNLLGTSGTCTGVIDTAFTAQQIALFTSLDTVNLTGTVKPDSTNKLGVFPNPFYISQVFGTRVSFRNTVAGAVVVKYVLTDSLLNPVFKKVTYVTYNAPSGSSSFLFDPSGIVAGGYRLFYTFSALGNNNYKRGWVNLTAVN